MTLSDINTRVSFYIGSATNFASADRLLSLNNSIYEIETEIIKSQDGWRWDDSNNTDLPVATTNLVTGQSDYLLPTDNITVDRLEITYDGTNWVKVNRIDINEDGNPTDSSSVANNYSTANPFYQLIGRSVILFPTPTENVSNGLKIWGSRLSSAFTSGDYTGGTKSIGFDKNFHEAVAIKMSMDYCIANDMPRTGSLSSLWMSNLDKVRNFYGNRDKDTKYSFTSSNKDYN